MHADTTRRDAEIKRGATRVTALTYVIVGGLLFGFSLADLVGYIETSGYLTPILNSPVGWLIPLIAGPIMVVGIYAIIKSYRR